MADTSAYPGALDGDLRALVALGTTPSASEDFLQLVADAVAKVEAELGTNPSGPEATVAARLTADEGGLATHAADSTAVHGIADTAALVLTSDARLSDARTPTGAAGGVLSGTFPNPGFAVDMATQAELDAAVAAEVARADGAYVSSFGVLPSGDTTGATDVTNIEAAIAAAVAAGGGTVTLGRGGPWYINDKVVVPDSVNLWGQGIGEDSAATVLVCTAVGAGVAFGTATTGGRGGVSGNFTVDGDDVATEPLYIGMTVQRTFVALESVRSAGAGLKVVNAQNNTFVGTCVSHSAGAAVVFDESPQANRFYGVELDSAGTWFVVFQQTGSPPVGLAGAPFDNHIYGGIFERVATTGGVWQDAGDGNGIHNVQVVHVETDATFDFVKVDAGTFTVDGGLLQSNVADQGTAFVVASGATLIVTGEPTVAGVDTVYNNSGTVDLNGMLRAVSYTTFLTGTAPNEKVSFGYAALGSSPVFAADASGLGTAAAPHPASWWRLDPANWPAPPAGRTLQYRFRVYANQLTAGDTFSAQPLDITNGGAGLTAEFSDVATADGGAEAVSPWTAFPASPVHGYVNVRNQTAARGTSVACAIDVRIA